jgi:hypothetical protein
MSKAAFGIADFLQPASRIYYENIFSQFQIGRAVDLITALADGKGVPLPTLRVILNAGITEACHYQALFESTLPSLDPVMIEYGADNKHIATAISFTFDESHRAVLASLKNELLKPNSEVAFLRSLHWVATLASEVVLKVDLENRRVEILVHLPLGAAVVSPGPIRYVEIESDKTSSMPMTASDHEYIELGDVAYEKLLDEKPGSAQSQPSAANKIINAATGEQAKIEAEASHQLERILAQAEGRVEGELGSPTRSREGEPGSSTHSIEGEQGSLARVEKVIEAISNALGPEQMAETIKHCLSPEQVSALLARAAPEKIAEILTEQLSDNDLKQLVLESMSKEAKSQALATADPKFVSEVLRKAMSKDEVRNVLQGMGDEAKAQVLAAGDPDAAAGHLKKAMTQEQISNVLLNALPESVQSKVLAEGLPAKEVATLLQENLSAERKAGLIAEADPAACAKIIRKKLDKDAVERLLLGSLPDAEKAKALAAGLSPAEIAKTVGENLSTVDKARLLAQTDPELTARMIRKNANPEEIARLIAGSLSAEEKGTVLRGKLDAEEVATLIHDSLPDAEKAVALAKLDPAAAVAELQQAVEAGQLAEILKKHAKDEDFAESLIKGLPLEEQLCLIKGSLPDAELATIISGAIPQDMLAQLVRESMGAGKDDNAELVRRFCAGAGEEEVARLIKGSMPEAELTKLLSGELPKEACAQAMLALPSNELAVLMESAMEEPEFARGLLDAMPVDELAKSLTEALPAGRLGQLAVAQMNETQLLNVLSTGMSRQAFAQDLVSALPTERYASILLEGLPPQEIAKALAAGLPKERFAELLLTALPKQELAEVLAKAENASEKGESPTSSDPSAPSQTVLKSEQVEELMDAGLNPLRAVSVLSKVLPRAVAESICTGEISAEEIGKTLADHLEDPALVPAVLERVMALRASVAQSGPLNPENTPDNTNGEPGASQPGDENIKGGVSVEKELEIRSKTAESRLTASQKSAEFYKFRSIELENRLKAAEEQKNLALKAVQTARQETERLHTKWADEESDNLKPKSRSSRPSAKVAATANAVSSANPAQPVTAGVPSETVEPDGPSLGSLAQSKPRGATDAENPNPNFLERVADREKDARRFFQQKSREIETELRKTEEEVKVLKAEKAKALIEKAALQSPPSVAQDVPQGVGPESPSAEARQDKEVITMLQTKLRDAESALQEARAAKNPWAERPSVERNSADRHAPNEGSEDLDEETNSNEPGWAESMEGETAELDLDVEGTVRKFEELKESMTDERSRKRVADLLNGLMEEKIRFKDRKLKLTENLRKKAFAFQNQEVKLNEELRQSQALAHQRQSMVDRMKQVMGEMQVRLAKDKEHQSEASVNETQVRIRFEQSQRQIELLNKEIERLGRRARQAPAAQAGAATQQRGMVELQKQAEAAQKALQAKKQEVEFIRKQLAEKDVKEAEYKRALVRMQMELNVAKQADKKSA